MDCQCLKMESSVDWKTENVRMFVAASTPSKCNPKMSNRARTHSIQPPHNMNAKIRVQQPIRFRAHSIHLGLTKVRPKSPRFGYVVEQTRLSRIDITHNFVGCVVMKLSSW